MAFVSSFAPVALTSTFTQAPVTSSRVMRSAPRFSMSGKSPSVPFMNVPEALSEDLPGYVGFDPLNISSFMNLKWLQEAEIKHGRVCMLAILGLVVAELYTFPFYTDAPHLAINRHNWSVSNGSLTQILLWCSFFEIMTMPAVIQMVNGKSERAPGDFKFDPLGLGKDPTKMNTFKVNEVKNGRLAMCAVSGAIHHAAITNQNLIEQITSGNVVAKF